MTVPMKSLKLGVPEEPCFFSNGSVRNNRQWLGWKPPPPRSIEHDEFCKDMNEAPLPRDSEERKNFDQLETFILGILQPL